MGGYGLTCQLESAANHLRHYQSASTPPSEQELARIRKLLSHVSIEGSAGSSEHAAWHVGPDILADTSLPCFRNTAGVVRRISQINQFLPSGTPAVLKRDQRSEEHTSELQSLRHLVCRL